MALTTTYCNVQDVKRYLQTVGAHSITTPETDETKRMIIDAEDDIDQMTNHSWKTKSVTDEYYSFPRNAHYRWETGIAIALRHRNIKTMLSGTDKIEVWRGNAYTEYVANNTEGRGDDYWLDYGQGVLYIRIWPLFYITKAIRMTYRYGENVPNDIRKACALSVAIQFLLMDDRASVLSETGDSARIDYSSRIDKYQKMIEKIVRNRFEIPIF